MRRRVGLAIVTIVALGAAPVGQAALGGLLGSTSPVPATPPATLTGDEVGIGLDIGGDDGGVDVDVEVGDVGVEVGAGGAGGGVGVGIEVGAGDSEVGVEATAGGGAVVVGVDSGGADAEASVSGSGVSVQAQPPPAPEAQAPPEAPPEAGPRASQPSPVPVEAPTSPAASGPAPAIRSNAPKGQFAWAPVTIDASTTRRMTRPQVTAAATGESVARDFGQARRPVSGVVAGAGASVASRGAPLPAPAAPVLETIAAPAAAASSRPDPERSLLQSGLGRGTGLLGDLALLLFIFVPAGVLLLSAVPGRAGHPGVGRSIAEERVTVVAVAVAMWVGVAIALLFGGP